jgi:hypothetical protein
MKETILDNIRQLAEQNDGLAPGMVRFERETGIAVSDWRGKYWSKWSEAVAEAGVELADFTPKTESEVVLKGYRAACIAYGRIPTEPEFKIFARQQPMAVSASTVLRHFGSKSALVEALRAWATKNGDDVLLPLIPTAIEHSSTAGGERLQEGLVYLLQSGAHFKVGRSYELEKRIKQISISLPEKVELVHAIKTDDPPGIEAYWHRRFADKRANGEWFALSTADVRAFKRRKFQ